MKFSLIDGQRQEAQPGSLGTCPVCDQAMVAKCGDVKTWHWAHKGRRRCDPWWENETEWHRTWKGLFPEGWQEVVQKAASGERHIADVKTDQGWVLEFQHSPIAPEERRSREAFYRKLVWVVDGTRRKKDWTQFVNALNRGTPIGSPAPIRIPFSVGCTILREWGDSDAPVFIDFGAEQNLWWLLKRTPNGSTYVAPFARSNFVEIHRVGATQEALGAFEGFVKDLSNLILQFESRLMAQAMRPPDPLSALSFHHRHMRRSSYRKRF